MNTLPYHRIVVVGTTSSGKSTLAEQLAEKIGAEFIDLDSLHWEPNWVGAKPEVFRERVETATSSKPALSEVERGWVVAGNYHVVRDIIWRRAEIIIWLDYPFHIVFWRLLTRTIRRVVTKEKLFSGNVENGWMHLKLWSQESLFHWLFKTYWRRKREYPILFAFPENAHLKVIHFKHPKEAESWLNNVAASKAW